MVQAGSQPITLNALQTEWIRDFSKSPHADAFVGAMGWYDPEIKRVRERLASGDEVLTTV